MSESELPGFETSGSQLPESRLGEVSRDGGVVVLRYRRRLAHPPDKVWRAITESEHLHHWFPADLIGDRAAGAHLTIRFWPEAVEQAGAEIEAAGVALDDPSLPGTVLVWEPPHVFVFTWDTEELRFDLTSDGAGTTLVLTVRTDKAGPRGFAGTAAGYHMCVDALVGHLDGGVGPDPAATVAALELAYEARIPAP